MRALAVQRIAGNWDTWGYLYGKNMYLYKPTQGPWAMTAWDIDFSFGLVGHPANSGLEDNTQDPLATRFRTQPAFRRAMWCAYRDAVDGPMVTATVNARIDAMVAGLAANGITANAGQVSTVKTYISARRDYIITQLNAAYPGTTFALSGSSIRGDQDGCRMADGVDAGAVPRAAQGGHRAPGLEPAQRRTSHRHVPLRGLRAAGVLIERQVRERHRLAELHGTASARRRHLG